jgi:CO dehydrogenase/acetyl-CoA synthase epsilon subunit
MVYGVSGSIGDQAQLEDILEVDLGTVERRSKQARPPAFNHDLCLPERVRPLLVIGPDLTYDLDWLEVVSKLKQLD